MWFGIDFVRLLAYGRNQKSIPKTMAENAAKNIAESANPRLNIACRMIYLQSLYKSAGIDSIGPLDMLVLQAIS